MVMRLSDMQATGGYALGRAPMVNLARGAQNGFAPAMAEILSSGTYVQRHLNCIVIDTPKGFNYLPDSDVWHAACKNIFESQAKGIDGLAAGLEVDWGSETPVGHAGEMFQDYVKVSRARSNVTFTLPERPGMATSNFFSDWITYLIADPNTQYPAIIHLGETPDDWWPDQYTATMLFYETDPLYKYVYKAWLVANMAPKSNGEVTGKREIGGSMEAKNELSIEMTGVAMYGFGVKALAQNILSAQQIGGAIYENAVAFASEVSADVLKQDTGYTQGIQNLANNVYTRG